MIDVPTATLTELVTQLTAPFDEQQPYTWEFFNSQGDRLAGFARRHTVTHPPLLTLLEAAAVPVGDPDTASAGVFESAPAADLEAIEVLDRIRRDLTDWTRKLGIPAPAKVHSETPKLVHTGRTSTRPRTAALAQSIDRALRDLAQRVNLENELPDMLRALAAAETTAVIHAALLRAARGWVRDARIAVGIDPGPRNLRDRCPYCPPNYAPMLAVTGDLHRIHCPRCGVAWTPDHYQLLRRLLNENRDRDTLAEPARITG